MTLKLESKPADYKPPSWGKVEALLRDLKAERQPRIDKIKDIKKARRNQWNDVVQKLPAAYRNLPIVVGETDIPEMISRITGLVAKGEPLVEVMPPSGRMADLHKAAKEEARLQALRIGIQDQQDRDVWFMGIDSQAAWGESWISVWVEGKKYFGEKYKRGEQEKGEDYSGRVKKMMTEDGIPIRMEDHDPQTIFPLWDARQRLQKLIIESEHPIYEIEDVYGYTAHKNADGEVLDWNKKALGEARVPSDQRSGNVGNGVDITHDNLSSGGGSGAPAGKTVKKVIYMDDFCCRVFLDTHPVETWQHDYGAVPMFYAAAKQSSDRDPAFATEGVADVALVVAKQMVFFAAAMASSAYMHGFPTAFLRNPSMGMLDPKTGKPLTRTMNLGGMNVLGPQEEIEFPMLNAHMGPDFMKAMDMLSGKLDSTTLGGFNKALGTDMAGYALAQVRSMQMSVLGTMYANAKRQWRKIYYFLRHIIKHDLKGGIVLRGAVDETDDGEQFRPILDYGPDDTTEFAIEVHIPEGIMQDEMAERKSAIELGQAGYWSPRRVMEATGVDDPAQELEEIATGRLLNSPMADEMKLNLAMQMIAERMQATQQATNTPFNQMLDAAKGQVLGAGMPQNQGAGPQNALPGGEPMQQNPGPATPLQGGPTTGPGGGAGGQGATGIPQIPGGVSGGNPPAGAPG